MFAHVILCVLAAPIEEKMKSNSKKRKREKSAGTFYPLSTFFSFFFSDFFEGFMKKGYMWVVRLKLVSVRLGEVNERTDEKDLFRRFDLFFFILFS